MAMRRQLAMADPAKTTKCRATRDLVFEEDVEDVNAKSQKANGDEPFVATCELTHN